jgi:hypothetical protein
LKNIVKSQIAAAVAAVMILRCCCNGASQHFSISAKSKSIMRRLRGLNKIAALQQLQQSNFLLVLQQFVAKGLHPRGCGEKQVMKFLRYMLLG